MNRSLLVAILVVLMIIIGMGAIYWIARTVYVNDFENGQAERYGQQCDDRHPCPAGYVCRVLQCPGCGSRCSSTASQ